MKLVRTLKFIVFCLVILCFMSLINVNLIFASENKNICNNPLTQKILEDSEETFQYLENRNDIGIFYDFEFDKINKVIIKRKNGFPIVRFSLFEKEKIIPGKTIVNSFNNIDLSKLNDDQINELHKTSGKVNLQLNNGEKLVLESKPYKLNDFKLSHFDFKSIHDIDTSRGILELSFLANFTNKRTDLYEILKDTELLDDGLHEVCFELRKELLWPIDSIELDEFKYDADIREGLKNKEIIVTSVFDITYDNDEVRTYRTEKGVSFFRQNFDFKKFPFDKQKLIIRIKTGTGNYKYENEQNGRKEGSVTLITPEVGPYLNLRKFIDKEENKLKAWTILEEGTKIISKEIIDNNYYDKWTKKVVTRSENVIDIELLIERNFQHYLFKIILPVFLILCVAWYILWIPTWKYEARLNTSIIALLALIAYNFVFQDDIPKLEYLTDLDWFILLSYIFCCIPVFLSIGFSKFISKNQLMVTKINKKIRYLGIILYLLINLQIFYN